MGVGLDFAVAVVFLFLALGTKVRPWLPSGPLKDKRRILSAVPAPVPIVIATSFNIIDHQFPSMFPFTNMSSFGKNFSVQDVSFKPISFQKQQTKNTCLKQKSKRKLHCRGHRYNQAERE
jgi:hypothetical protein